jgi:hypothetical protein
MRPKVIFRMGRPVAAFMMVAVMLIRRAGSGRVAG